MPLYLMLTTLTEKGVQTLNSNPGRLREVNRDIEELGAKILHQWASLGEYDFVNIVEAPERRHAREALGHARCPRELEDRVAAAHRGGRRARRARDASSDSARSDASRSRSPVASPSSGLTGRPGAGSTVEPPGRDVVRRLRVEERREQLDLVAADAELELAAAVGADPVRRRSSRRRRRAARPSRTATASRSPSAAASGAPRCRRPSGSRRPR